MAAPTPIAQKHFPDWSRTFLLAAVVLIIGMPVQVLSDEKLRGDSLKGLESIQILSLDPKNRNIVPTKQDFHQWPVLGSVLVTEMKAIRTILEDVQRETSPWQPNRCVFVPRHGLRLKYAGKTVDYVICYHCGDFWRFEGEILETYSIVLGAAPTKETLDTRLREAHVPLAP